MKFKYFLFDFDGTLVNSMPTFVSSMLRILNENNISYGSDITKTITPLGLGGTADYFIDNLGLNMNKERLMGIMVEYMSEAYFNTIPLKENVQDVLNKLKSNGASLNILTASPHVTLDACLKRLGIWELFDNVWSCDDFGTNKANPQIYVSAAQKIGAEVNKVLFLDDNLNADITAKKAGMAVCGVYDASSDDYVQEIKDNTDYYIYNFSELLDI